MPFERYLHYVPDHESADQPSGSQQPVPLYQDYTLPRSDVFHYDPSIFSGHVQFQMPQLVLGPTLAPGGGAEVLPAGIVGRQSAIDNNWLEDFPAARDDSWYLPPQARSRSSISDALVMPPYHQSTQSGSHGSSMGTPPDDQTSSSTTSPTASTFSPAASLPTHHAHQLASEAQISNLRTALANSGPSIPVSLPFVLPPVGGLPVYSTSGFDILSLLARVATRPHPKITLGPVDMTCSFVVVDVRRFDHPIVYASQTFCRLTGYAEEEILGRNCRFLQAPSGQVQKGEPRRHTAQDAVAHMRKSLVADKECQVSLVNYRKNGSAFINLVTVIPIPGGVHNAPHEAEDVVYQVGFQVDLTEQPNAILQKLRDGSYMVNYSNNMSYPMAQKDVKANGATATGVSKQLRNALNNQDFVNSIPISTSTTTLSIAPDEKNDPYDGNRLLSLMLLEKSPDFVVVLSLKGAFLYISPSVTRALGYDADELVGKSITEYCHEADKVPLIRELKESSIILPSHAMNADKVPHSPLRERDDTTPSDRAAQKSPAAATGGPRIVDLLFRMQGKNGDFVWVECSGKLFVEPGKGRKAIILSGRVRNVPSLKWDAVARAGGLAEPACTSSAVHAHSPRSSADSASRERECWALLSVGGSILHAGSGVREILGWGAAEVIGRPLGDFVAGSDRAHGRAIVLETLQQAYAESIMESRALSVHLLRKDGASVPAELTFFHPPPDALGSGTSGGSSRPLVCQIRRAQQVPPTAAPSPLVHAGVDDVFAELDTARGSGWQYELQQLKYANQRLLEEVEEVESKVELRQAPAPYRRDFGRPNPALDGAWASQLLGVSTSLKRAWDGTAVGTSGSGRT